MVKQVHPVIKDKFTGIRKAHIIGRPPGVVQWVASDHEQTAAPRAEAGHHGEAGMGGQPADLEGTINHAHCERLHLGEKVAGSCQQAQVLHADDIE